MARKDALIKLYARLQARRKELLHAIADELQDLRRELGGRAGSDDADAATESVNQEVTSQLAQIESRELMQIDRAIRRIREGNYGSCELCNRKIPVARLNALPYTTLCIECQREIESDPGLAENLESAWQKVYDHERSARDVTVRLSDLEMNLG